MKQVELIRNRITRGMNSEVQRIRSFIACTDGNDEAVAKLCDDGFQELIIALTETLMEHLGHPSAVDSLGRTRESRLLSRGKRRSVL